MKFSTQLMIIPLVYTIRDFTWCLCWRVSSKIVIIFACTSPKKCIDFDKLFTNHKSLLTKVFVIVLIFSIQMKHLSTLLLALCNFMLFFHGASSHLFPQAALHLVTNGAIPKEYKRQASDDDIVQCVSETLEAAFQGNNSHFVSECKFAGMQVIGDGNSSELQSQINRIVRTFCNRECGNIILNAYIDCGLFDKDDGNYKFTVDLCGTNQNGYMCYELYGNGLDLMTTEASCYTSYTVTRTCTCRSSLSAGVTIQGCCINAYHDLVDSLDTSYSPATLYSVCNVNTPEDCNNSPLTASTSAPTTSTSGSLFFSALSALVLTTILE